MKKEGLSGGLLLIIFGMVTILHAQETAFSFDECLNLARKNNTRQRISQADIAIAQQLLRQAQSSYWPTISVGMVASSFDQDPVFTIPSSQVGSLTIADRQLKVMDKQNLLTTINATLPLYTGGLRGALTDQAKQNIVVAHEAARRTDLELIRDVQRFYYGAVMAGQLVRLAENTILRMESTENLTEQLYQTGSGMVKKTDYLRVKSANCMLHSTQADVQSRYLKARAALNHAIGNSAFVVVPSETELPTLTEPPTTQQLMAKARLTNPDLGKIQAGIASAEADIRAARSGHLPTLGAFATYSHIENDYDMGLMDPINKDSGLVGLSLSIPLFEGFRVSSEVAAAKTKLDKLRLQQTELTNSIRLQIELARIEWAKADAQVKAITEGLQAARENRDLNERAYRESLVETPDVIQAQLMEALLELQQIQALYECITGSGKIDFLAGGKRCEKELE